jgi:hypothetical protein
MTYGWSDEGEFDDGSLATTGRTGLVDRGWPKLGRDCSRCR